VADQFAEIRKQLDVQLIRTGQLQSDLDLQRRDTIQLRQQLKVIQALLKESLSHLATDIPARDRVDSNQGSASSGHRCPATRQRRPALRGSANGTRVRETHRP
jgi:hypothetical protein